MEFIECYTRGKRLINTTIDDIEAYMEKREILPMIDAVMNAGKRAAKIVENMLSFSRNSTSNFIPRSLVELVEQALVLASSDYDMKHKFDFRRIGIVREFSKVPNVPCESSQIQQVVFADRQGPGLLHIAEQVVHQR